MREYRLTTVRIKIDKQKDVNIAIFKELECYLFNFLAKGRLILVFRQAKFIISMHILTALNIVFDKCSSLIASGMCHMSHYVARYEMMCILITVNTHHRYN